MIITSITAESGSVQFKLKPENEAEIALVNLLSGCSGSFVDVENEELTIVATVKPY